MVNKDAYRRPGPPAQIKNYTGILFIQMSLKRQAWRLKNRSLNNPK